MKSCKWPYTVYINRDNFNFLNTKQLYTEIWGNHPGIVVEKLCTFEKFNAHETFKIIIIGCENYDLGFS